MTGRELYRSVAAMGWTTELSMKQNFYTAANLALASVSRLKRCVNSISLEGEELYDLEKCVPDFEAFAENPIVGYVRDRDYGIEGRSLLLTGRGIGKRKIRVLYYTLPYSVSEDTLDREIELLPELSHLLVLLTAFYALLDDDTEKAEYYYRAYMNEKEALLRGCKHSSEECVINLSGW